jgi:putative transport protein
MDKPRRNERAGDFPVSLAIAIGTLLARLRSRGFAISATACTLLVAVLLGQLGTFGPEFFASLSLQTLAQVALSLVMAVSGLAVILIFAHSFQLGPGAAAGCLTQTSMMGTAASALEQLGLSPAVLQQEQANIAAGYAVTYVCGYVLVLLLVPLIAPRRMGVNLKQQAAKLEAALAGTEAEAPAQLLYPKFQARAYRVTTAAGQTVAALEAQIGRRVVIERILRCDRDVESDASTRLELGDEILLAWPSGVVVAATSSIGPEIEGEHVMRSVPGEVLEVFVTARHLHGRTLGEIVKELGEAAHGVFLRTLLRRGHEVPIGPLTRIYVGDVMSLVGLTRDSDRVVHRVGRALRANDRTDTAFLAGGPAVGLLLGLASLSLGSIPLTLGGGGGALVAGLVCGWLRSRRPTMGAFPPAAQQSLIDLGLGGFVAAIGLASGPAAVAAIATHGCMLLGTGIVVTLTPSSSARSLRNRCCA